MSAIKNSHMPIFSGYGDFFVAIVTELGVTETNGDVFLLTDLPLITVTLVDPTIFWKFHIISCRHQLSVSSSGGSI